MTIFDLGTEMPLPAASPEMQHRLATRRSASAQSLTGPGPSDDHITTILTLGTRTPDHGKLFPWRLVVMGPDSRADIARALTPLAAQQAEPTKATAVLAKLTAPPLTILVISTPDPAHKVPVWEQEMSAGAVCMNIEHAASAFGFATSWITDWYSNDPAATALFGIKPGERIAGFIHIGSVTEPPLERVRPDIGAITTRLD